MSNELDSAKAPINSHTSECISPSQIAQEGTHTVRQSPSQPAQSSPNAIASSQKPMQIARTSTAKPCFKRGFAVVEYFKSKQNEENESKKKRKNEETILFASPTRSPLRRQQQMRQAQNAFRSPQRLRGEKPLGSLLSRLSSPARIHSDNSSLSTKTPLIQHSHAKSEEKDANLNKCTKVVHSQKSAKSPFQSFQNKVAQAQARETTEESECKTNIQETAAIPPAPVTASSHVTKSMCFAIESTATCVDVTPDGECFVVAFDDGSIRLFDMDSSVPSDRFGYLLGHFEVSAPESKLVHLRVKITLDGKYIFAGCRVGPRVMLAINLQDFRNDEKEDQAARYSHTNSKLKGFSDICKPPESVLSGTSDAYLILSGLGVQTLHLWQFTEPDASQREVWQHLLSFQTNGNTALYAKFLPFTDACPKRFTFASSSEDKNIRFWCVDVQETESDAVKVCKNGWLLRVQHKDIPNTRNALSVFGAYAYGLHPSGEGIYRVFLSNVLTQEPSIEYFTNEKFSSGKSRRSCAILSSIYASNDGNSIAAISTDGILYCATKRVNANWEYLLRIAGRLDTKASQLVTPVTVYANLIGNETVGMIAVLTNPSSSAGFLNVDPINDIISRYGQYETFHPKCVCWVCHVPNARHWDENATNHSAKVRALPVSESVKKPTQESVKKISQESVKNVSQESVKKASQESIHVQLSNTEQELELYKTRYNQIVMEWQRRLKGERQMRRLFKIREQEFKQQLLAAESRSSALQNQINASDSQGSVCAELLKMEKEQTHSVQLRYEIFCDQMKVEMEKLEQQKRAVEKTSQVLLQEIERHVQMSKSSGFSIGKASMECIVCKVKDAVVAIIPCGHMCFCENDGERYQNIRSDACTQHQKQSAPSCPICQREIISLLRVY